MTSEVLATGDTASAAAPVVLEYKGVSKVYPTAQKGGIRALNPVDLTIRQGEFITLVGPSGCGKSTLLNITAALLDATSGEVLFKGARMIEPDRRVAAMFQAPVLFPWRTIEKNVLLPAEISGIRSDTVVDRVRHVLDLVGLGEFKGSYPSQLSGGMQQRAALARVLAYDPEVLLMDEPFGALDEFTRETMNLELMKIVRQTNITVLFVTHNIPEAVFLADRVIVMSSRPGRVSGIINVPFGESRTVDTMRDPRFTELTFQVRSILAGDEA
jgi:NitT/TauT family transport system ATP-binding protein